MKFLSFILLVLLVAEQYNCSLYYSKNHYDDVYPWRHDCFGSHYHRRFHTPWYRNGYYDMYDDFFDISEDKTTDKLVNIQPSRTDQPETKPLGRLPDQASDNLLQYPLLDKPLDRSLEKPLDRPLDQRLDQPSKAALYLLLDYPLDQAVRPAPRPAFRQTFGGTLRKILGLTLNCP